MQTAFRQTCLFSQAGVEILFLWKQIVHLSRPTLWPKCCVTSRASLSLGFLVWKEGIITLTSQNVVGIVGHS